MKSKFSTVKNKLKMPKRYLYLVLLCLFAISSIDAQVTSDSSFYRLVQSAISSGDAEMLSTVVFNKVDIVIPGQSGIYSKNQLVFILASFFENNKPKSFTFMNKSKNNTTGYFVGKLYTTDKNFRVWFLTKVENEHLHIYQIRIEE